VSFLRRTLFLPGFPALLLFLSLLCPARAGGLSLSPEAQDSLRSTKVADRELALRELGDDPSDAAAELLEALCAGDLYVRRDNGALLILRPGAEEATLVPGSEKIPFADRTLLRKVGISNSRRTAVTAVLNRRLLRHADVDVRRGAVESLRADDAADKELLLSLLQNERDGRIRARLEQLLALLCVRDDGASRDELLRAAAVLGGASLPQAAQALANLKEHKDPLVAAAVDKALYRLRVTADRAAMLETLFFGLSLGSVLVLTSIGLAVTFGVMGVINMAHGELVMLGAYTVWGMQQLLPGRPGTALLLAVPASFLVAGCAGALLERSVIRHLYGRPLETLLATFGISLILQQAVRTLISPMNRAVESPAFMSGMLHITDNFSLTCNRVYILAFCLGVFVLIYATMHKTRLGLEVRAVAQNRPIAKALGIDASRVDTLTFALGSGVAGMAGAALSQLTNVGPNLGQSYIVDSFMVVVFGGVGNLHGTLCGGLILGLANKLLEPVSGAMLAKIILLTVLILFMQVKPKGLFPERGRAAEN
jgi:urea transport system permease protein